MIGYPTNILLVFVVVIIIAVVCTIIGIALMRVKTENHKSELVDKPGVTTPQSSRKRPD